MALLADRGHSRNSHLLLFLRDVACLSSLGCIGEVEETEDRNRECDDSICEDASSASDWSKFSK